MWKKMFELACRVQEAPFSDHKIKGPFIPNLWRYCFFAFMNVMYGLLFFCSIRTFHYVHTHIMEGGYVQQIQTQINVVLALQAKLPIKSVL
jgi:hypothetical protein